MFLANCTLHERFARTVDPKYGVPASPRVVEEGQPVPRGGGHYRVGDPYTIAGRTFVPREDPSYRAEGVASWYGRAFHGRLTANGEVFDKNAISAAHPTLPIPSYVRVTNLSNQRSLIVRVNDRGPFHDNRIIDLSARSAELLGFRQNGTARVRVEYVARASLDGSDDRKLIATLRQDGRPAPAQPVQVASTSRGMPAAAQRLAADSVPTPSERPYELGRYSAASVSHGSSPSRTTLAAPPPSGAQSGFVQSTTTAAGPALPPAISYNAVLSGRGLY